jgi:hypothetical protein
VGPRARWIEIFEVIEDHESGSIAQAMGFVTMRPVCVLALMDIKAAMAVVTTVTWGIVDIDIRRIREIIVQMALYTPLDVHL